MKLSAWSLILTAFTTLVAHLVSFPTASFEESIQLFQNSGYILRNNVIVLHCVLVVVSMLGLGLLEVKNNSGWIGLGFICFTVFSLAEITRMTTANVIVNGLREKYFLATSDTVKSSVSFLLREVWPMVGTELFLLFIFAFSLGCLLYGIAFFHRQWIGWIFLVWGAINLLAFANAFLQSSILGEIMNIFSSVYQPLARLVIGIWFLRVIQKQNGFEKVRSV